MLHVHLHNISTIHADAFVVMYDTSLPSNHNVWLPGISLELQITIEADIN